MDSVEEDLFEPRHQENNMNDAASGYTFNAFGLDADVLEMPRTPMLMAHFFNIRDRIE